ncbi:tRNA (N6-isopentenyl adenosine(37)-C2)-methylthiotransferase MiaB, partial [Lachnotalea glycerini]
MEKNVIKIDFNNIDISKEEPIHEPERQYYFIAKARKLVKDKSKKLGRPLTCMVTTFGCQMNQKDSEKLLGILELIGYEQADSEKADFVIYNTCTVRDNANQKVYGRLGFLNGVKRTNPNMLIALCGCMMQEPEAVEKIKKSYSFVDIIFGTHNIFKFAELLYTRLQSERMVIDIWKGTNDIVE